jgi:hypothetical protein
MALFSVAEHCNKLLAVKDKDAKQQIDLVLSVVVAHFADNRLDSTLDKVGQEFLHLAVTHIIAEQQIPGVKQYSPTLTLDVDLTSPIVTARLVGETNDTNHVLTKTIPNRVGAANVATNAALPAGSRENTQRRGNDTSITVGPNADRLAGRIGGATGATKTTIELQSISAIDPAVPESAAPAKEKAGGE